MESAYSNLQKKVNALEKQLEDVREAADAQNGVLYIENQGSAYKINNISPNVKLIMCNYTGEITSLPDIPEGVTFLRCSYNNLTQLPKLPSTLTFLDCLFNNLTELPDLPEGLRVFHWEFNHKLNKRYPELQTLSSLENNKLFTVDQYPMHSNIKNIVAYVNKVNRELREVARSADERMTAIAGANIQQLN